MKKILVTGSLGYIGSVLTGYLCKNGYEVVGIDTGFFNHALLYRPQSTETIFRDARTIEKKDLEDIFIML